LQAPARRVAVWLEEKQCKSERFWPGWFGELAWVGGVSEGINPKMKLFENPNKKTRKLNNTKAKK
jgi:hypothetical protein